jgi:LuxR family maltose regulon positive regulatory protein
MLTQRNTLLATKLHIPHLRLDVVPRPRLTRRLNEGTRRKLILITAPAGFGKTTLLSEWVTQCRLATAWISLHPDDNHPQRFFSYLIAALETLQPGIDEQIQSLLPTSQPPLSEPVLTTLLNALIALPDDFALVLDDYHFINDQQIHQSLNFLLEHLPLQMHLIIATRVELPIPLARLRGQGQVSELHAKDLRFTSNEVALFNQIMNLGLSPEDMAILEMRIEGWIAGLHLAALSMQGHGDTSAFIKAFSGSNRYILDYLSEEVFSRQPEHLQAFLLHTSILDHLTGSLCDAVTGRSDSQSILEMLEQAGIFIVPLDDERCWYRYHQLFAGILYQRLCQASPSLPPELHRRASEWYEHHEMVSKAIEHALAAGDFTRAMCLTEQQADSMWMRGDLPTLLEWLQALPGDLVRSRPKLCLFYAWAFYTIGQVDAAMPYLQAAERELNARIDNAQMNAAVQPLETPGKHTSPEHTELQSMLAVVRASMAIMQGDTTRTIEHAQSALAQTSEETSPWRGVMTLGLGFTYQSAGDMVAASRAIHEASRISRYAGNDYTRLFALSTLAQLQVEQGHLSEGARTYRQVIQEAETIRGQLATVTGWAYIGMGEVLREWNEIDEGVRSVIEGIERGQQGGNESLIASGYTTLARLKLAQGNVDDALDLTMKVEQLARTCTIPLMASHAAAMQALLWLARGNIEVARHWMRETKLSVNDELNYAREFEHVTLARVLLALGQYDTVLPFLHRLFLAAEAGGRMRRVIEVLLLQAIGYTHVQNATTRAITALGRALSLAQAEGYVRTFVDEGPPMLSLISAFRTFPAQQSPASQHDVQQYVEKLLTILGENHGPARNGLSPGHKGLSMLDQPPVEPLSEREVEILHFIAAGMSNREIAQQMVITVGTIKWHLANIYGKLNVHSRTQALVQARALGLLP